MRKNGFISKNILTIASITMLERLLLLLLKKNGRNKLVLCVVIYNKDIVLNKSHGRAKVQKKLPSVDGVVNLVVRGIRHSELVSNCNDD